MSQHGFYPPMRGTNPVDAGCGRCVECLTPTWKLGEAVMVLCPDCGNKRCPKATDHRLACTGSNDPGQRGSVYGQPMSDAEVEEWMKQIRSSVRVQKFLEASFDNVGGGK